MRVPIPPPEHRTGEPPRFAVVIPAYNHGDRVALVVTRTLDLGLPVIVVDDGSTDHTERVLQGVGGIEVLRHGTNRGKGAALLAGMHRAAAVADYAITIDADGQHDPAEAHRLMDAIPAGRRVIMVGRRAMAEAPWTSRKGRAFSNFWVWMAGGPRLSDSQSGFRIYPLPEVLSLGIVARRYQFEVEVLARASWQGIPVVEVPVSANYGADLPRISHFRPFVDFLRNFGAFSRLITRRVLTPALWRTGTQRSQTG